MSCVMSPPAPLLWDTKVFKALFTPMPKPHKSELHADGSAKTRAFSDSYFPILVL